MKEITRLMIEQYNLKDIDFMGYHFNKRNATYHHLIIPKRLNGPEVISNGAILNGDTSHPYLHLIESKDYDMFLAITSEMIDENIKGKIDIDNLRRINEILTEFENEYGNIKTKKGKRLIKENYIWGRK